MFSRLNHRLKTTMTNANFRYFTALFCVGATLSLGVSAARADEDSKPHHRRHHQVARKAEAADKRATVAPTRDDRRPQEIEGRAAGGATGPEYRVVTGSNIPQRYNRRGYTTDSRDNLFIYDQNDIRLQRTNNVADSLRDVPGLTVRGGR